MGKQACEVEMQNKRHEKQHVYARDRNRQNEIEQRYRNVKQMTIRVMKYTGITIKEILNRM